MTGSSSAILVVKRGRSHWSQIQQSLNFSDFHFLKERINQIVFTIIILILFYGARGGSTCKFTLHPPTARINRSKIERHQPTQREKRAKTHENTRKHAKNAQKHAKSPGNQAKNTQSARQKLGKPPKNTRFLPLLQESHLKVQGWENGLNKMHYF